MAMKIDPDFSYLMDVIRNPVKSSNVAAIAYVVRPRGIILVEFLGGEVYGYLDCSLKEYEELEAAESKGKFVYRRLRDIKECVRVA